MAALWARIHTSLNYKNVRHKQKSGKNTLARQKTFLNPALKGHLTHLVEASTPAENAECPRLKG
jgi:hypothetical protein